MTSKKRLFFTLGLLLLLLALSACRGKGSPEAKFFYHFLAVLKVDDHKQYMKMLASKVIRKLYEKAARLRKLSGGLVNRKPHQLLDVGRFRILQARRSVQVLRRSPGKAVLKVKLHPSGHEEVTLVKEKGKWKVQLPLPDDKILKNAAAVKKVRADNPSSP